MLVFKDISLNYTAEHAFARKQFGYRIGLFDSAIDLEGHTEENDHFADAVIVVAIAEEQNDEDDLYGGRGTFAMRRMITKTKRKRRKGVWMVE